MGKLRKSGGTAVTSSPPAAPSLSPEQQPRTGAQGPLARARGPRHAPHSLQKELLLLILANKRHQETCVELAQKQNTHVKQTLRAYLGLFPSNTFPEQQR